MNYSFTEKKRVRKSFAKRVGALPVPFLLSTQLESYAAFLQAYTPPEQRKNDGLQAAFNGIFPIHSHSKNARLDFVSYQLGMPPFDVKECQQRGLTLRVAAARQGAPDHHGQGSTKPTVKEVKEQEVYMGEIPLMTTTGSFVINGTERVIVSQLHRSPGVFFEHDRGKTHSSGKLLFSARIIPYRGSWLDFEFDPKDILYLPRRPPPQDAGHDPAQGDRHDARSRSWRISSTSSISTCTQEGADSWNSCRNVCAAKYGAFRYSGQSRQGHRGQGQAHQRQACARNGSGRHQANSMCRKNSCSGACLPKMWSTRRPAKSSRNANDEITEAMLHALRSCSAQEIQTLYTNDLDQGAYISQTLRIDETADQMAARVAIYRMMRPGEPPTEEAVETCSTACSSTKIAMTCRPWAA